MLKTWISAARPRTLFLAASTVILGSGLAWHENKFNTLTFVLAFLLAIAIQVLANFANDLGDFQKGTDTTGKRLGPTRALQSGNITHSQMKKGVKIAVIVSAIIGLALIWNSANDIGATSMLIMAGLGLLCIVAALFYTMGKYAYGYRGWGDLLAFLFFGPVPVIGTYFLHVHSFDFQPVLPSIGLGFISAMILNINNMRDIENDKASGKITIAARLGLQNARVYHALLTFGMFACFIGYSVLYAPSPWYRYLYVVVFLMQVAILKNVFQQQRRELDPNLKKTSISGFLLVIAFVICINI